LIIGLTVAAVAVAAGAFVAVDHTGAGTTAPAPPSGVGPDAGSTASAVAPEPVIGGEHDTDPRGRARRDAGESTLANVLGGAGGEPGAGSAGQAAAPRTPFDVLHDEFARALPGCATAVRRPVRVTIEVTWNGSIGLPIHSSYSPAALRECLTPTMLQYGQIVPQSEPVVTRRFVYDLR
jgi:hypothetical protein